MISTLTTPSIVWPELNKQHLILDDIAPVIDTLTAMPNVECNIIGHSYEQRPIHSMSLGHGPIRVLAWTQMHGDEPTATAAVLDIIQILLNGTEIPAKQFFTEFTFCVIPMLNPDGAQHKTRENAQGIDINRDAVKLTSPEAQVLMEVVKTFKPDIALNLHDQNPYYSAGKSQKPSTIAFLAPPYNESKEVNKTRERAMRLIAGMRVAVEQHIPDQVARYDDEYSFRSFGDTIAGLGASTILIESGAQFDDPQRQTARQMNIVAIMTVFKAMLENSWSAHTCEDYWSIPENLENGFADILLRDVKIHEDKQLPHYCTDLTFRRQEKSRKATLDAMGDLAHHAAFIDIDATDLAFTAGKGYPLNKPTPLNKASYMALLSQGYSYFVGNPQWLLNHSGWPALCLADAHHTLFPGTDGFGLLLSNGKVVSAILANQYIEISHHE
ncbi:M14 family zinc carboxypeptidase [Alteromonas facilis]|uniref:M14 family zinc carboxypeptidase n=1 Tax=Alteromonas facilis TaxID=2048004 RepID=UPI000C28B795|nr:M14 family zinc carboxypeptidase [Alteromonas facilis]